jgi:DNA-binding response OmpR family regulator
MHKPRILVVDDDPNISNLLAVLLTRCSGCEVRVENRPYAARAAAAEFLPELILLDVDMPGKDGGELAAEFQADPCFAKVPIIFLTSLVSPDEGGEEVVMRGGMPFLGKPVNHKVLDRTIKRLLGKTTELAA